MPRDAGFTDIKQSGLDGAWVEQVKPMNLKDRLILGYWYWRYS
jgi:hypothetical protein